MSTDSTRRIYDDESHTCTLFKTTMPYPSLTRFATVLQQDQNHGLQGPIPPAEVSRVARRLKHQVEQLIHCEVETSDITRPTSSIVTRHVVLKAKRAGGDKNAACVVFCLLMARKWFNRLAVLELWDAGLHHLRAITCDIIAKRL